jgi:hypothetical protein
LSSEANEPASGFDGAPSEKTVRDWVASGRLERHEHLQPWTLADAERPEDIPLVLECVNVFHRRLWPTVVTGQWIARLRRAYPDLLPMDAHDLARRAAWEDPLTFARYLAERRDANPEAAITRAAALLRAKQGREGQ